ncbi:hypothetical protein FACS1894217_05230 [Clostridia bacterium]|nr:hypothetical protein FACS1894217_05230 [Clostridia bacterium]
MSTGELLSLYHTISGLDTKEYAVVARMLKGLTDEQYVIELLSEQEAEPYQKGFDEIERGEYVTLQQLKADRNEYSHEEAAT